jgi:hypothetical protein
LNVKKPGAKMQGKLLSLKTDSNWYEYPPVKFLTQFQSTGNVHVRPTGNIFIKNWLGQQVATLNVNNSQATVLPDTIKTFDSSWNDSFITNEPKLEYGQPKLDKNGKPQTQLKINWEKILNIRIGPYTASEVLVISTDTKDIPYEAHVSFFVFPWKLVLGSILFIIFAGIGFYNSIKNLVRKIIRIFGTGKNKTTDK